MGRTRKRYSAEFKRQAAIILDTETQEPLGPPKNRQMIATLHQQNSQSLHASCATLNLPRGSYYRAAAPMATGLEDRGLGDLIEDLLRELAAHGVTCSPERARQGKWKLHLGNGKLYNLAEDIGEETGVAAAHPEVVAKLTALAETERASTGDKTTVPKVGLSAAASKKETEKKDPPGSSLASPKGGSARNGPRGVASAVD